MPFDTHRIFNGSAESPDYVTSLSLDARAEGVLRKARDEIREALRVGLREWSASIAKRDLFDVALQSVEPPALRPKFRMQGSFSYSTCNEPAHQPPQEIDLDDGLFLPVSFLSRNGGAHPAVISTGLFLAVERVLQPLCDEKGWVLDKSKPSCVRVKLEGHAHIDVALYAIPDSQFAQLLEKIALSGAVLLSDRSYEELRDSRDLTDEVYRGLSGDQIMLAHRQEGWKPSDPRKLEDWFREAVETHGEQLRRVCRYLKGWRDYQWDVCRLASIALMAAVVEAYKEAAEALPGNRDDLALLLVAERLPEILSNTIANPVVTGQRLDEGWTTELRAEYVAEARDLLRRLQDALLGTDSPQAAIASLIAAFGPRIPNDPTLVQAERMSAPNAKSAIGAPAVLRSGRDQMAASIASLDDAERNRRAEAAARAVEDRGTASKPWSR